MYTIVRLDCKL